MYVANTAILKLIMGFALTGEYFHRWHWSVLPRVL